jgi:hypothetical protein
VIEQKVREQEAQIISQQQEIDCKKNLREQLLASESNQLKQRMQILENENNNKFVMQIISMNVEDKMIFYHETN